MIKWIAAVGGAIIAGVVVFLLNQVLWQGNDQDDELPLSITGTDGAYMMLIPAGEIQGMHHDAFYMDKYEVTNVLYNKFVDATKYRPKYWGDPKFEDSNEPDHPVVGVNWRDAKAYAQWARKQLPTEGEWEYAARGGLVGTDYPWNDGITRNKANYARNKANYAGIGARDEWENTSPVGSFPPNGYGLYDMAGNVLEWCADDTDSGGVLRGGSYAESIKNISVKYRLSIDPLNSNTNIGFRCIQPVATPPAPE